jgi:SAM-dependent methyltransferase
LRSVDTAGLPDHVAENRRHWDEMASEWVEAGERAWATDEPTWGIWGIPNGELRLLDDDLRGVRAIELGCGTGYVSAWMRRRGASVYAIDNSEAQLATARRLAAAHGLDDIEWVHGNAEVVDQPDESFDLAISEYGAAIWCDPHAWIPEAHRLLRAGGRLVVLGNHPLGMVCTPVAGDAPAGLTLERDYFGLGRLDWTDALDDPGGIEFNMEISSWLRLFRTVGFDVVDYVEIQAPASATGTRFWVGADWAKRFPVGAGVDPAEALSSTDRHGVDHDVLAVAADLRVVVAAAGDQHQFLTGVAPDALAGQLGLPVHRAFGDLVEAHAPVVEGDFDLFARLHAAEPGERSLRAVPDTCAASTVAPGLARGGAVLVPADLGLVGDLHLAVEFESDRRTGKRATSMVCICSPTGRGRGATMLGDGAAAGTSCCASGESASSVSVAAAPSSSRVLRLGGGIDPGWHRRRCHVGGDVVDVENDLVAAPSGDETGDCQSGTCEECGDDDDREAREPHVT